jgi:rfaE bifunctional protein kinase chain/domain
MNKTDLAKKFQSLSSLRVGVVGDVMLDKYTYGKVDRISPEAPIPIIHIQSEVSFLGGAGNVFANLAALGTQVVVVGTYGADDAGHKVSELLQKADTTLMVVDASKPTIVKQRIVAGNQQLLRIDHEDVTPLDTALTEKICSKLDEAFSGVHAICIADYGKGLITKKLAQAVMKYAKEHTIPVVVDTKPKNIHFYNDCTLISPNENELLQMTEAGSVAERAQALATATQSNILVTRGGDGVLFADAQDAGNNFTLPSFATDVRDVSGAGDTVVAFVVVALALGLSMKDAVTMANQAAAISVSKPHTAVVTANELLEIV